MHATIETRYAPLPLPLPLTRVSADARATPLPALCSTCHLKDLCLPCGLAGADVERLDGMMFSRRRVKAGEALYQEGDPFRFVYAVRSGTFKSTVSLKDGRDQATGFHMAGEVMGLDGLAHGSHATCAIALEDAEVCAIPYAGLNQAGAGNAGLQEAISRLMSREIVREHGLMLLLGSMNAEQRLAAFLLNLSQRMKARGYSATEFHLRMSRADIGSYLGMKLETVSRAFSAFQQQGLLEVDKRHIRIVDGAALARLVDGPFQ